MIKDLAASFRKAQEQHHDIVQDNYKLKEGIYIRLNPNQSWEEQARNFERNHLVIYAKEDEPQDPNLSWFKLRDYFSSLVSMNKPVDPKKQVHSSNPFALFVKRDVFLGEKQDMKSGMKENIERFLSATQVEQVKQRWSELIPGAKSKQGTGELSFFRVSDYAAALDYLDSPDRVHRVERIAEWYRSNLSPLIEFIRQLNFKNYVKLYFELDSSATPESPVDKQMYADEYTLYTIPKIYNNNDYNQIVDNQLVGLPSYDMTMNSKKPFMEHKTMRIAAPDRVPLEQALLAKETTEWLAAARPKYSTNKIGYDTGFVSGGKSAIEGTMHVYMDGKDNELHDFENVPFPPTVSCEIEWLNILRLKEDGDLKEYRMISDVGDLQKKVSGSFFRGRMNGQFVAGDPPDVKNKEFTAVMIALFLQSRQAFHDWFHKGTTVSLRPIFAKVTLRLLEEQLLHVETSKLEALADAYNLRLSIIIYLNGKGGNSMADRIQTIVNSLREKLAGESIATCSSDGEFYFTAGQLAYYILHQSKAHSIKCDVFEPFLRARNDRQVKKSLDQAFQLYKHEILPNYRKFSNAFSMVMGYESSSGNEGNSRELLLAGIFAANLFYEKNAKEVESSDETK